MSSISGIQNTAALQTSASSNGAENIQNQIRQLQQDIVKEQQSDDDSKTKQRIIQVLQQKIQLLKMLEQQKRLQGQDPNFQASSVQSVNSSDSVNSTKSSNTVDFMA